MLQRFAAMWRQQECCYQVELTSQLGPLMAAPRYMQPHLKGMLLLLASYWLLVLISMLVLMTPAVPPLC
jgi:hypothetical protein